MSRGGGNLLYQQNASRSQETEDFQTLLSRGDLPQLKQALLDSEQDFSQKLLQQRIKAIYQQTASQVFPNSSDDYQQLFDIDNVYLKLPWLKFRGFLGQQGTLPLYQ